MLGWYPDFGRRCSDPAKSRRGVLECGYRAALGMTPLRCPVKRDTRRRQLALDLERGAVAQRRGEEGCVGYTACHDADRIQTIGKRLDTGARNRAETRLIADDAA